MDNGNISRKQCAAIMCSFLLGSSMVLGVGSGAGRDAWIAILAAIPAAALIMFVYARILSLFPGNGIYEILSIVFGKFFGTVTILLYSWYAFHLGALVIRNFTEFVKIVGLHETPQYITGFFMIFLCIWALKKGIEVVGRWAVIMFPIMLATIILVTFLLIPEMEVENLLPVFDNGFDKILDASFSVISFPFAELVVCMAVFSNVNPKNKPYSIFLWSIAIGGTVLLLTTLRSILVLGEANLELQYFASYASVRLVEIGEFLERIEVSVSIVFLLGGFVKTCICLLGAAKGISEALRIKEYSLLIAPVGLLMLLFSLILFNSTMEMFNWAEKFYRYYALPFEFLLPLIIWIGAELKSRKRRLSDCHK